MSSIPPQLLPKPTSTLLPILSHRSSHKFSRPNSINFNPKCRAPLPCSSSKLSSEMNDDSNKSISRAFLGFAAGAFAMASVLACDTPALAESLTVAFPVSRSIEVNRVQRTLIEAWGLIRESFIDPTFNHQDWDLKLQQTMVEMFPLKSADAAYSKISGMVASLGDPFTRIITPKEYQSFRIGSDGNLQGVGLFINVEPTTGHLVVVSCVEDSPAARAGIHEGDELVEINGQKLDGIDSETAALMLRGRAGTTVKVKVHSGKDSLQSSCREVKAHRFPRLQLIEKLPS